MSDSFTLRVLTPTGLVLEESVSAVTFPGADGEVGVLPGHAHYSGLLGIGILDYEPASATSAQQMVVSSGFCTFQNDTLEIFADSVDLAEEIDRNQYAGKRPELEKVVESTSSFEPEWQAARNGIARMNAIDQLIARVDKHSLN